MTRRGFPLLVNLFCPTLPSTTCFEQRRGVCTHYHQPVTKREAEGLLCPTRPPPFVSSPKGGLYPPPPPCRSKREMEGGICAHPSPPSLISRDTALLHLPPTHTLVFWGMGGPSQCEMECIYAHHPSVSRSKG